MSASESSQKFKARQILIAVLIVGLLVGGFVLLHYWDVRQDEYRNSDSASASYGEKFRVRYNNTWYELRENVETVLLIGLDKFEDYSSETSYRNNRQSDFLLLCIIDHDRKTVSAIHLNRDSMADVPVLSINGEVIGTNYEQLALAYTYGSGGPDSCRNTRNAVSGFLYDLPIDHYVSVTMDAVAILNDSVDGVEVVIPEDMTSVDPAMVKGATVKLTGEQALKFVRARMSLEDSTNLSRMKRQRTYLQALFDKVLNKYRNDAGYVTSTYLELAEYLASDYSLPQISTTAKTISEYKTGKIEETPGEAVRGEKFTEFYVDDSALQKLLIDLMFVEEAAF